MRNEVLNENNKSYVTVEALFESEDAFKNYQKHELRLAATKDAIVPFVDTTTHVEYEL